MPGESELNPAAPEAPAAQAAPTAPTAPAASAPTPAPAAPSTPTIDEAEVSRRIAEALKTERAAAEARVAQAASEAAEKAVAAERKRLEEEAARAALTEQERTKADLEAAKAEADRMRTEAEAKTKLAAQAEAKTGFLRELQSQKIEVGRDKDGRTDPQLEALAFELVQSKITAGVSLDQAVAEAKAEKPWMFAADAPPSPPTNTAGSQPRGTVVTPPPKTEQANDAKVFKMPQPEWSAHKRQLGIA